MTKKAKITTAIIAVLILVVGASLYFTKPATAPDTTNNQYPTTTLPTVTPTSSKQTGPAEPTDTTPRYTMAQVATHGDAKSCWTVIRGQVYDLTAWVAEHPGGSQAILGICGKDGTEAFVGQHGGNPRQENVLAGFEIGIVAQ